jgi:hypothetical protein
VFYTWAIFAAVMVPIVLLTVRRVSGSAHGAAMH